MLLIVGAFVAIELSDGPARTPTAATAGLAATQPELPARNPLIAGTLFASAANKKQNSVPLRSAKRASRPAPRRKKTDGTTGRRHHSSTSPIRAAHNSPVTHSTGAYVSASTYTSTATSYTPAPASTSQHYTPSNTQSSSSQPAGPTGTSAGAVGSNCDPKCQR